MIETISWIYQWVNHHHPSPSNHIVDFIHHIEAMVDFNLWWAKEWLSTPTFREWRREVDPRIVLDYPNVM